MRGCMDACVRTCVCFTLQWGKLTPRYALLERMCALLAFPQSSIALRRPNFAHEQKFLDPCKGVPKKGSPAIAANDQHMLWTKTRRIQTRNGCRNYPSADQLQRLLESPSSGPLARKVVHHLASSPLPNLPSLHRRARRGKTILIHDMSMIIYSSSYM